MEGKTPKGKAVTCLSIGFVLGIAIFSFIAPLPLREGAFCLGGAALIVLALRETRAKSIWQSAAWILLGTVFGIVRYAASQPRIGLDHISYYNGETISVRAVVVREPVDRGASRQLTLNVSRLSRMDRLRKKTETRTGHGLILVSVPPWPAYAYGDEIDVMCGLEKPQNKDFPYDRYLARYGIYSLCSRPKISLLARDKGNPVFSAILQVKHRAYELAQAYMPEPTASLALPVVFGGGQGIEEDITEQFRRTGLTHIMAVSGFNVSLLAVLLGFAFLSFGLGRRFAFYATSLVITVYVLMVGAPASAVRAGVMSIFLLLALTAGRLASLPRSVLLVAVATLLVNPRLLRDDIGWQLSFLALLGLMYVLPYLEKWSLLLTKGKYKAFITAFMATVAAQLATAPVILYNFGNFSIIAPVANLLVVWVVPLLTVSMMATLPLVAFFPALGSLLFFPSWAMAKYIFFVVKFLAQFSWAAVQIEK